MLCQIVGLAGVNTPEGMPGWESSREGPSREFEEGTR